MTMTTTTGPDSGRHHTKQKVGLVICALYGLANIPSAFVPIDTGRRGRPAVRRSWWSSSILGVISVVAAIMAWRGNRVVAPGRGRRDHRAHAHRAAGLLRRRADGSSRRSSGSSVS